MESFDFNLRIPKLEGGGGSLVGMVDLGFGVMSSAH